MKRVMGMNERVNELRKWEEKDIEQLVVCGVVSLAVRRGKTERGVMMDCLSGYDEAAAEKLAEQL